MNATNFLRVLIIAVSLVFFSCEDEPVEPLPVSPDSGLPCSVPENVTATRSTDTSMATVLWETNVDQGSWQLQYGNVGFVLGSGTVVYSTAPSKIFTGLVENMGYDFYIRSVCSETQFSDWVGPITVPPLGVIITADYWPMAVQNQWVYSIDNVNEVRWKLNGTEVIAGNTYHTLQPLPDEPIRKIRKSATGDYFDRYEDYTDGTGTTISGHETIILKDYVPVGSSWTDTYIETVTEMGLPPEDSNVEIVSTIMAIGATLTVPSNTFNNVIVVKRVKTVTGVGMPTTTSTETYYFAKDVGPIQVKTEENGTTTFQKLTAYILY